MGFFLHSRRENRQKEDLKATSHPIKTVLTEGKVVRGIGNAYVDEILYSAKVCLFSKAKIPENKVDVIIKTIRTVLADAENHISKVFPDTITEKEGDFLQVHQNRCFGNSSLIWMSLVMIYKSTKLFQ